LERIPVTKEGYESLKEELNRLKRVERPENIKAIEEARAHGDLSENAEFAAAKDRQGFIEGRISELQYKLANADIIEPDKLNKDKAVFGCKVYYWKTSRPARTLNISLLGLTSPI